MLNPEPVCQQQPVGTKQAHNLPVAHAAQVVFFYEVKFCLHAAHVLKPYLVLFSVFIISEKRRLRGFVKLYLGVVVISSQGSLHLADCSGAGYALLKRQCPVVSLVWYAEADFFSRDAGKGIFDDLAYHIDRCDRHRRAIRIAPFIGHQQDAVGSLA